jgi:ribosomal protein S18 acetylase RimI-like enzyme
MPDLRVATSDEGPRLSLIAQEAYAPYVERLGGLRPAPMDVDYGAAIAESEVWVAEVAGEVAGFLVLVADSDSMLLDGVAVRPSFQGRGVGRALLTLAEERTRAAGHDRISLYTNEVMVENQALYERIGYVETDRANVHGFARIFYAKTLGEEETSRRVPRRRS